jgi:hypothetical protein
MLTYAQNFKNVMWERLFKEVDKGFHVDFGAWDPTINSVTRHFYERGWSRHRADRIPMRMLEAERKRDISLRLAVGPRRGVMTFCEAEEKSYLSTLHAKVAAEARERWLTIHEHRIEVTTLRRRF